MTTYKPSIFDLCPDIMGLVLDEVAKCKFNKVMTELSDPRFHKAATRLIKGKRWCSKGIHPGRFLVSVTYPQLSSRYVSNMSPFKGERLNLYGLTVDYSEASTWQHQTNHQYNIKHYTANMLTKTQKCPKSSYGGI